MFTNLGPQRCPGYYIVTPYIFSFISRPTLLIISKLSGEHSRGTKRSKGFCVMIGQTHKQTEIKLYIKRFVWSQLLLGFPFAKLLRNFCGTKRNIFLSLRISFARKNNNLRFAKVISRKIALFRFCETQVLRNSAIS